jgi:cold shock CspA family protein
MNKVKKVDSGLSSLTDGKPHVRRRAGIKKVFVDLPDRFVGMYKKHRISISTLEKGDKVVFDIEVTDERGCYAVNTWEDLPTIDDAIDYALNGACL